MKNLIFFGFFLFAVGSLNASGPIITPVIISTGTGATQSGGFHTSTGTVDNFTASTITVGGFSLNGSTFTAPAGSTVTFGGIFQAKGITSGATPSAGFIGEVISTVSQSASNVATSNQWGGDYVRLDLTAGGWLIFAMDDFNIGTSSTTQISWGIGLASGNSTIGVTTGKTRCELGGIAYIQPNGDYSCPIITEVEITSSTSYWLKSFALYSVATPQARGALVGIRIH